MKNIKIIGAGAGSGKTYRLADEVFNAIKKRNITPGGILLTTFTKKAAAELKSRVAERLIELG